MIEVAAIYNENEKPVSKKTDKDNDKNQKDISKTIEGFGKEYHEKIAKLEEIFWKLEKTLSESENNDFRYTKKWLIWALQSKFEKIQSFIYPQVNEKIWYLNTCMDSLIVLAGNVSDGKKPYSLDDFDSIRHSIESIFNYNDLDYMDINKEQPMDTEMFEYIKNKTNDRTAIFISKLENIKYEKYIDLESSAMMFAVTFNADKRYDYVLERILQNNCGLIQTPWELEQLARVLGEVPNLMKSYADIIENNQDLSLLLIEGRVRELNYWKVLLKAAWDEESKKAVNEVSDGQYNNLIIFIEKYLLLHNLRKENADKIHEIINNNIKNEDKERLMSLKDFW